MNEKDPHLITREWSERYDLLIGTIHNILHEDLHMKILAARWMPNLETEEIKVRPVACLRRLLDNSEPNGPKRLCNIAVGDKTLFMLYGIPNKRFKRVWVSPDGDRSVVLRPIFQRRKRLFSLFIRPEMVVAVDFLQVKAPTTAFQYTKMLLSKVVSGIYKKRPTAGTPKTLIFHHNAGAHKPKVTTTFLDE